MKTQNGLVQIMSIRHHPRHHSPVGPFLALADPPGRLATLHLPTVGFAPQLSQGSTGVKVGGTQIAKRSIAYLLSRVTLQYLRRKTPPAAEFFLDNQLQLGHNDY